VFAPAEGAAPRPPTDTSPAALSFRLLADCPMNVLLVVQLHLRQLQPGLLRLLPAMAAVAAIAAPDAATLPADLQQALLELRTVQVKSLSFVTWMLRSLQSYIPNLLEAVDAPTLVGSIVTLLAACPDSVALRKELLTATKQALSTPLKGLF